MAFGALAAWPAVAWHRRGRQRRRGRQQHGPGALRQHGPGALRQHWPAALLRHGPAALRRHGPAALRRAVPEPGARPPAAPEPWALRPVVSVAAALVLLGLVAWFAVSLGTGGRVGLAERFAAAAQACWPLIAVLSSRRPGRALAPAPNAARRH